MEKARHEFHEFPRSKSAEDFSRLLAISVTAIVRIGPYCLAGITLDRV